MSKLKIVEELVKTSENDKDAKQVRNKKDFLPPDETSYLKQCQSKRITKQNKCIYYCMLTFMFVLVWFAYWSWKDSHLFKDKADEMVFEIRTKILELNKFQKLFDSQHEIINNLTETVEKQREDIHVLKQEIDQQNNVNDEQRNETKHLNLVIERREQENKRLLEEIREYTQQINKLNVKLKKLRDKSQEQSKEIENLTKIKEKLKDLTYKLNEKNKVLDLKSANSKWSSKWSSPANSGRSRSWSISSWNLVLLSWWIIGMSYPI